MEQGAGAQDGPSQSPAAVPEEAHLCCVCGGSRDLCGRPQVRLAAGDWRPCALWPWDRSWQFTGTRKVLSGCFDN